MSNGLSFSFRMSLLSVYFLFASIQSFAFPSLRDDSELQSEVLKSLSTGASYFELKRVDSVERYGISYSSRFQELRQQGKLVKILRSKVDLYELDEREVRCNELRDYVVSSKQIRIFGFTLIHFDSSDDFDLSNFDVFKNRQIFEPSLSFRTRLTALITQESLQILKDEEVGEATEMILLERKLLERMRNDGMRRQYKPFEVQKMSLVNIADDLLRVDEEVQELCLNWKSARNSSLHWIQSNLPKVVEYAKSHISPGGLQDLPEWFFAKTLNLGILDKLPYPSTPNSKTVDAYCSAILR